VKISRRQLGWVSVSLGLTTAAFLWWYAASRSRAPRPMGVTLSAVEHAVAPMGTVTCTVRITNVLERRVLVQADLERPVNGQWQNIPCSQPGPMYCSALWLLHPGEVKTVVLPTPPDRGDDVPYRIRVDYRPQVGALRVWKEKLRETGTAFLGRLLGRKPPRTGFVVNNSRYWVIGGRGGTAIDSARCCAYTEAWNDVQQMDAPSPALAPLFQFEGDWRGVGDP